MIQEGAETTEEEEQRMVEDDPQDEIVVVEALDMLEWVEEEVVDMTGEVEDGELEVVHALIKVEAGVLS